MRLLCLKLRIGHNRRNLDFNDFIRLLRSVTPENKGLDREAPHWQTCSWILEDPAFVKWKENKNGSLLFITGSPGCGKSNLAKYIQGAMKDSSDESWEENLVIPFYCDSLESSRHNPPILDLVVQSMLSKYTTMSQATRKKLESVLETLGVDRQKSRSPLETENSGHFIQLMEIVQLLATAEDARPTCLIIDGLDQCEDEFIIRLLRGLDTIFRREASASALKVVVTSRMADSIRGFALANNHIEVTPDLILNDIQKVVDEEVDRIILSRRIATVGRASVSAVIVERSNGSFLFASAVLKELWHIKDTGANSVFTLVTSCPPTMEAIYQQDMDRIQNERNDLFQLIQIICIARSTLRIEEAKEILRFLNPSVTRTYDLVGDLTRTCQRLIRFGAEDTLELLHQTLYDFILDTYDLKLKRAWGSKSPSPTRSFALFRAQTPSPSRSRSRSSNGSRTRSPPAIERPQTPSSAAGKQTEDMTKAGYLSDGTDDSWDADLVIKEIFSKALELNPNRFLHKIYDLLLHISPKSKQQVEEDLETLVNNIWEGTTAIHYAAAQPGAALEVLLPFARNVDLPDNDGSTPLILAAVRGHCRSVRALLKAGAKVDAVDPWNQTALFTAVDVGAVDVVQTLLEFGADPNISSINGHSPLALATGKNSSEMVEILLEGQTIIHAAAEGGNTQVLETILEAVDDSSLEIRDRAQRTPLWYACVEGHEDMVKYLLERGASTDVIFDDGDNIIPIIVSGGSEKNLKLVLEKNPNLDTDCILPDGETPLFKAVNSGHDKVVPILLERGADVNRKSKYGNVPIFGAITNRQYDTLRILLEHDSIDLTQRDSFDRTALQIAQQSGTRLMPAIVLGAAQDSDVERILTENRDMYGLNAYDLTRPEANNPAPFDRCVEGVRRDAQSLLDDFDLHGVRWERLGKFLLQLGSYSFAQIALQRSARAVETTPLVLQHDNYCDMCLATITGPRYVCCTCCTVDLCELCVRQDKKPGNRTWGCDYHSFLTVNLPQIQAPDVMLRTEIDFHVPTLLSPIEEVASETSQGGAESDGDEPFREPSSLQDDEKAQDGVSLSSGDTSNSYTMAIEPLTTQSSTAVTGYSVDDGELPDNATNKSSALAKEEWSDRTEDELREFLEAVLKTFTTYQTPNGISKWNFSVDGWTLRYKDDALKSSWTEGDENAKIVQPAREWMPLQPLTEAYYYLSGLSYLMADVPLYLVATGLAFHGYEDEALRRRKRLQRLHHKVMFPVTRHGEVVV
ncbi:hypothetical protein FOC4_g10008140 [Fusarium odoratissimum]|uniref:AAA+ ATPase domain-containing protein n=1 Tax=Fusarium oxysporum f. sp. cubense (strain race 4) TaxID=2502994 RepID=N1RKG9_FUSC4|nr:hypothetical protein FOC4_g10008140 [Fusarium odoratissimum]